jgi:hypothetical protein
MTPTTRGLVPFVAGRHIARGLPDRAPALRYDPQRVSDAPFLGGLRVIDRIFFGPRDQIMPSWVLYDCALAPGLVFGLAAPPDDLPPSLRSEFPAMDLVPVSMMSVLPLPNRRASLVHTLAWLPLEAQSDLGLDTLRLGRDALDLDVILATAGWDTPELEVFARLGPLRLRTAWTPAHDTKATATFELHRRPPPLVPHSPRPATTDEALIDLQSRLEAGLPLWLTAHLASVAVPASRP